ncbi:hypothetical protein [Deinococcus aquatilis]|uniref:hypothetical protein n=1 Tax=Deinococcus aquatilis TaxID=519440 RepID=UPI001B7FBB53|nr:hypothetical protein [Deinococcus aquatilis]
MMHLIDLTYGAQTLHGTIARVDQNVTGRKDHAVCYADDEYRKDRRSSSELLFSLVLVRHLSDQSQRSTGIEVPVKFKLRVDLHAALNGVNKLGREPTTEADVVNTLVHVHPPTKVLPGIAEVPMSVEEGRFGTLGIPGPDDGERMRESFTRGEVLHGDGVRLEWSRGNVRHTNLAGRDRAIDKNRIALRESLQRNLQTTSCEGL